MPPTPCSCQTTTAASADGVKAIRARTAAAGTSLTYRELDDRIREALVMHYGTGDDPWVWVRDWDDTWAVFESETPATPLGGGGSGFYQVAISIQPDGTVVVDTSSVVEVETVYQPVTSGEAPSGPASPGPELPMVAHATDTTAIAGLTERVNRIDQSLLDISASLARLTAQQMDPAEVVAELPEAPVLE